MKNNEVVRIAIAETSVIIRGGLHSQSVVLVYFSKAKP